MLNGMLWRAKTGTPWRDLPARFGSWKTAYSRFRLWSQDDVFQKLFESLTGDADIQDASIDSTSCKTHVVECFFNKLKQFRSIATRYDKLSRNFLSFVFLAAAIILLK
jgi:transposase